MTKLTALLASITIAASYSLPTRAEESGLVCALVPVLTESFLKTHVAIKNASDEIYQHTADQMIKRIDPSKVILLQSDVDALRPKVLTFLKTMKTAPDCSDIEAVKPLLV
ncbi:MAG: hypothetical protein EOP11_15035, partial [Proteobacteria bacterium]